MQQTTSVWKTTKFLRHSEDVVVKNLEKKENENENEKRFLRIPLESVYERESAIEIYFSLPFLFCYNNNYNEMNNKYQHQGVA